MLTQHGLQAIVLAIVQGITEFLPISSSGHLVLTSWLFGWDDLGFGFDIALHAGTLVAVLVYFRQEWVLMFRGIQSLALSKGKASSNPNHEKLALFVILGTIPAVIAGLLTKNAIEEHLRQPLAVGLLLIGTGTLLFVGERFGKRVVALTKMRLPDALTIGMAQMLGLLPGISRSGVTITAGLLRGMNREAAARFSFLLAAPLILGAASLETVELIRDGSNMNVSWIWFVIGASISAITALVCIRWLLRFLRRGTLKPFSAYCLVVGIGVTIASLFVR